METDGGDVDERGRNSESRYIRRRERGREWYYIWWEAIEDAQNGIEFREGVGREGRVGEERETVRK